MSWIEVDRTLVRYSAEEGTYYFYDPNYPTAIQFLLSGRWEPWDVGWVLHHARDPVIRRIAREAEAHLTSDRTYNYQPWPTQPSVRAEDEDSTVNRAPSQNQPSVGSRVLRRSPEAAHLSRLTSNDIHDTVAGATALPSASSLTSSSHFVEARPQTIYTSPYSSRPQAVLVHDTLTLSETPQLAEGSNVTTIAYQAGQNVSSTSSDPQARLTSTQVSAANRETKVLLAMDGDGIRGLSSILLVESFVNALCIRLGCRMDPYQIFDLIGGVSMTGLFAVMIGRLRMQAHIAREEYLKLAKTIYQHKHQVLSSFASKIEVSQFAGANLEASVQELVKKHVDDVDEEFFDARHVSTNVFVISTKVEIGSNQAALIRSYPTRRLAGPETDAKMPTWQAIYSAIRPPRYFDSMISSDSRDRRGVIEPGLIDYGTAKNNPIRDLYYECRKLYSYNNDTMVILSIGTGEGVHREDELQEMCNSVQDRCREAALAAEKFEVDNKNLIEQGWIKYFRFNVPGMSTTPLEEWNQVANIMEKTHAYLAQPEVGIRFHTCVDIVANVLKGDRAGWPAAAA